MIRQIQEDFAPFSNSGITQSMLNDVMKWGLKFSEYGQEEFVRVKVIDSKIYQFNRQNALVNFRIIDQILNAIIDRYGLPDLDFIYFYAAGPELIAQDGTTTSGPVLAGNKVAGTKNVILFHDRQTFLNNETVYSWKKCVREVENAMTQYSWPQKTNKLFWRGSISDLKVLPPQGKKWQDYSIRGHLHELSLKHPQYLDVGITWFANLYRFGIFESMPLARMEPIAEHMKYKYQIVLDGYTCTNPGYAWRLLSNCLVFKVDSEKVQWFYRGLQPYIHYIPVKKDLSNLIYLIKWAMNHDLKAKEIMEKSRQFALKNLVNEEVAYAYFHAVLLKYASLQKFKVSLETSE